MVTSTTKMNSDSNKQKSSEILEHTYCNTNQVISNRNKLFHYYACLEFIVQWLESFFHEVWLRFKSFCTRYTYVCSIKKLFVSKNFVFQDLELYFNSHCFFFIIVFAKFVQIFSSFKHVYLGSVFHLIRYKVFQVYTDTYGFNLKQRI